MGSASDPLQEASIALQRGDATRAEEVLARVNADAARRTPESVMLYARALVMQQKIPAAVEALEQAAAASDRVADKVRLLNATADLLCTYPGSGDQDAERATAYLEQSLALDATGPAAARVRKNLCALYYRLKAYEAVQHHAAQLIVEPAHAWRASMWLASANFYLARKDRGLPYLRQALARWRECGADDLAWVLDTLVNYRLGNEAQAIVDAALAAGSDNPAVARVQAQLHYEGRRYQAVLDCLPAERADWLGDSPQARQFVFFMRGRSLDALGRFEEAHRSFVEMNATARDTYPRRAVKDYTQVWSGIDLRRIPRYEELAPPPVTPVFMVGFPRSGTTLLDTILDTQPEIETLSEVQGVMAAGNAMNRSGRNYPEDLPELTADEVLQLRDAYFAYIAEHRETEGYGEVLVDKLPLNILHMPFILALFPDARFIFSLRHPLDVCLSCFQQGFALNDEMLHFTDLESTFRRYRDVMTAFHRFQDTWQLSLLTVRYEALVGDFESTAERVFDFLGVRPDQSYKRFHEINQQKLVATPSRDQVTEPLYASSRYRWKNYASILEPYVHLVAPILERYGYEGP